MEQQKINKPNFKLIILLTLTVFAGLADLITTIIGVNYFGLHEVNLINRLYFPLGIVIWVIYTIIVLVAVEKLKPKYGKYFQFFIVGFCFYAPVSNLGLILGCLT